MLTPQDDLLGHQLATTFDHVGDSDPRWTERYWYTAHPFASGDMVIDFGLGWYPNRNVMDAFAGVAKGGKQYNFRASRNSRPNSLDPAVGPLKFEIIEGLRHHRITLAENDSALAFELDFLASLPGAEEAQSVRRRNGRLEENLARMTQFGRWQGWISVEGRRMAIDPEGWWGQRDHSWGIRSVMNTDAACPPLPVHRNFLWLWCMYQFDDFGISLFLKERAPGRAMYLSGSEVAWAATDRPAVRSIEAIEHDIEWADDPLGQTISTARLHLKFEDGGTRELLIQGLPARYYLKGGLYGGLNGWNHGDDRGRLHTAFDVWDLTNPSHRATARTLSDHVCRAISDRKTGIGISEYGVAEGYPLYLAPQRFPAL